MSAYIFMVAGCFFVLLYYLPIYFQAIRNVSAADSGIHNLPLVLGASLFTIVSGGLLTVWGHYVPLMAFGSTVGAVGAGLIYTLDITSSSGKWIGYQALVGAGLGLTFQISVIVAQAIVKPSDLSSVSAVILFFQTIGGAIFISAAQSGFTNKMLKELPLRAPGVNAALVIATGATDLRKVFTADQIPGILDAYMQGLRVPFIIAIACACVTALLAFTPRYESIKGKVKLDGGAA
jgi:MFS family permease